MSTSQRPSEIFQDPNAVAAHWPAGSHEPSQIVYVHAPAPPKRPNHVLHALLTLFTGGLWCPIWLLIAIRQSVKGDR